MWRSKAILRRGLLVHIRSDTGVEICFESGGQGLLDHFVLSQTTARMVLLRHVLVLVGEATACRGLLLDLSCRLGHACRQLG